MKAAGFYLRLFLCFSEPQPNFSKMSARRRRVKRKKTFLQIYSPEPPPIINKYKQDFGNLIFITNILRSVALYNSSLCYGNYSYLTATHI